MSLSTHRREAGEWPRFLLLGVVAVALAVVLALGSLAGAGNGRLRAVGQSASLLPATSLTARVATVWNCPGPLNLSGGSASISVANAGSHAARIVLQVAESAIVPGLTASHRLAPQLSREVVPAGSELTIPLKEAAVPPRLRAGLGRKAKGSKAKSRVHLRVYGAASLTVSGAAVAVSETAEQKRAVETSPCALGSSTRGYTAAGTTYDSSNLRLALFDPSAAPAVVNLSIGTSQGLAMPQALQGIVVPPESLAVVNLDRYVPQQARVAVAAEASVGHIVIGSLTNVAAHFTAASLGHRHSYLEEGKELAVGVGEPLRALSFSYGPSGPADSESVGLFNPASRPARVVVAVTAAGRSSHQSVVVGPGATLSVPLPSLGATGGRAPGRLTAAQAALPAGTGGYVTLRSESGLGIVADHETVVATSPGHLLLLTAPVGARAERSWLLAGAVRTKALGFELSLTDASKRPETASVQLIGGASSSPAPEAVALQPGITAGLDLAKVAGVAGAFGVLVRGDGPLLVAGALIPAGSVALPAFGGAAVASP